MTLTPSLRLFNSSRALRGSRTNGDVLPSRVSSRNAFQKHRRNYNGPQGKEQEHRRNERSSRSAVKDEGTLSDFFRFHSHARSAILDVKKWERLRLTTHSATVSLD